MPNKCECMIYLNDEGKKRYGNIYPTDQVPVQYPITETFKHAQLETPTARGYIVDYTRLTPEQVQQSLDYATANFPISREDALKGLKEGIPIRDIFVSSVAFCSLHSRMLMI